MKQKIHQVNAGENDELVSLDLTVNFHHEYFIDPTNCPWVSEDEFATALMSIALELFLRCFALNRRCHRFRRHLDE